MPTPEDETEPGERIDPWLRRAEIVAAMDELAAASRELKILFDRLDIAMRRAIDDIKSGAKSFDLALSMNLPGRRETLNDAARRARSGQHALLRALFRAAEAEGVSKADIARAWRVSRQLVSRMIKEST